MAIAALEKGVSGSSFLQSRVCSAIRKVAMSAAKVSDQRPFHVVVFLSIGDRQGYAPKSGEIIGILKRLKDEMSEDLAATQKVEEDRKANHAGLIAAKGGNCHFDINDRDETDPAGQSRSGGGEPEERRCRHAEVLGRWPGVGSNARWKL